MKEQLMSLYESGQFEVIFDLIVSLGLDEDKAEKAKSFFQKDSYKQRVWSQSLKTTIPSSETRRYAVSNLQTEAEKAIVECLAQFKDPLPVMNDFIEKMKPIIKEQLIIAFAGVNEKGYKYPNRTLASRKKTLVNVLLNDTPGEFGKNFIHANTWFLAGVYRTVAWDVAQEYHFVRSWLEYSIRQHNERLFLLIRKLHPKTLSKLTPEALEHLLVGIVKKDLSNNVSELISKIRDLVPQLKTEAMRKQFLFAFYDWQIDLSKLESPRDHEKLDFLLRLATESLKVKMPSTKFRILVSLKQHFKDISSKTIVKVFQDACRFKQRRRLTRVSFINEIFIWSLEALRIGKYKALQEVLSKISRNELYDLSYGIPLVVKETKLSVVSKSYGYDSKVTLIFEEGNYAGKSSFDIRYRNKHPFVNFVDHFKSRVDELDSGDGFISEEGMEVEDVIDELLEFFQKKNAETQSLILNHFEAEDYSAFAVKIQEHIEEVLSVC